MSITNTSANLELEVKTIIAQHLKTPVEKIQLDSTLREQLGVDSFGMFEITFEFQEKYKIEIPEEDLKTLVTVGDVLALLQKKLEEKKS